MSVVVVMPSRGRPAQAEVAIRALRETAARVDTRVVLVIDADDPKADEYRALAWDPIPYRTEVAIVVLDPDETGNLVKATNTVSLRVAHEDPGCIIGNLGDDHVARTEGWDRIVAEALATPGVAYGDDLLQGEALPTAPFISAEVVLALGYYALPDLEHMFIDNVWRDVGAQTGTLRYLPSVVIEHVHPAVGKATWDEGYIRVNSVKAIKRDHDRYYSWREHAMSHDIERVRTMLEARGVAA